MPALTLVRYNPPKSAMVLKKPITVLTKKTVGTSQTIFTMMKPSTLKTRKEHALPKKKSLWKWGKFHPAVRVARDLGNRRIDLGGHVTGHPSQNPEGRWTWTEGVEVRQISGQKGQWTEMGDLPTVCPILGETGL